MLAAAGALGAQVGASAQQTVIIGGGNAGPAVGGGAVSAPGRGAGVTVNDDVLNSLGPGGAAPAMPFAAPRTPVTAAPGQPSAAYRSPGTGEIMVTRPGILLYPPLEQPRSRLTLAPPAGTAMRSPPAQAPEPATAGEPSKSRIVAAPPKPAEPEPAPPPAAAPPPAQAQAAAEPARKPVVPPAPSAPQATTAPSQAPPPPPLSLTKELRETAPPAAPPAPATESAAAPAAVQGAARTTGEAPPAAPAQLRLAFAPDSAELSDSVKAQLTGFAERLGQESASRVQLLAYAAANGEGASRARRLSLSRALAVRAFLIDQGIRSTRLDVRALGDQVGDGPPDRVDIRQQ